MLFDGENHVQPDTVHELERGDAWLYEDGPHTVYVLW